MNELDTLNVHLLLVEDNEGYLELAITRLQKFGYQHIDTAQDEIEAQEKLDTHHFDVIVADMRLGTHIDGGFTIVDEVKQRNITSVVIILTANDSVVDCRKALKGYGCWDYIPKNLRGNKSALEELHHSIQAALIYLNHWGNPKDEKWIADNLPQLREQYLNRYIAVINQTVIEVAETEATLIQRIEERKLPLFLTVIQKIEAEILPAHSILELIQQGESTSLEFKQAFQYDANKPNRKNEALRFATLKTIAAFLNSEGGTLLLGVRDDGTIIGLEDDFSLLGEKRAPTDTLEQTLVNLMTDYLGNIFASFVTISFECLADKTVGIVKVKPATQPAFVKKQGEEIFFIRTGNSTRKLETKTEIFSYLREKRKY